jgi:hypothetical protein
VVYDAAATTSDKISSKDILRTRMLCQKSLKSIFIKFRTQKINEMCNIPHINPQIKVNKEDRKLTRKVLRNCAKNIGAYQMTGVALRLAQFSYIATILLIYKSNENEVEMKLQKIRQKYPFVNNYLELFTRLKKQEKY